MHSILLVTLRKVTMPVYRLCVFGILEKPFGILEKPVVLFVHFLPICTNMQLFLWNVQFEYHLLLEPRVDHLPPPSCSDFYLAYGDNKVHMYMSNLCYQSSILY